MAPDLAYQERQGQQQPQLEQHPWDAFVASKLGQPEELQVRNTFIHFEVERSLRRVLKKNNTEPSDPAVRSLGLVALELNSNGVDEFQEPYLQLDFDFHPTPESSPRAGCHPDANVVEQPQLAPRARIALDQLVLDSPLAEHKPVPAALLPSTPSRPSQMRVHPELTPEPKSVSCAPSHRIAGVSPLPAVPVFLEGDGIFFSLTLRRADDTGLGLHVEPTDDGRSLVVHSIVQGGAIEAWNRQAAARGGAAAFKAVQSGDKIACVNGSLEVESMLLEIRTKLLLKLMVVRSGACSEQRPREREVTSSPAACPPTVLGSAFADASR